ncbi:MAG: glycosyl transferase [Agathobacter sp.]|nr:glycosyl transferase [Agathobacter sp.]
MSLYQKIRKFVFDPQIRFGYLNKLGVFRHLSDDKFLKKVFKMRVGYELNLDEPKTFNEKLQWLKIHDRNPEYTRMVDKYEVKKYIAEKIGEEYIIPTLGVWDKFEDIDFDKLPNQFVLKCTHDSGGLVIVKDKAKLDKKAAKKKINQCLKQNYYYVGREWPYKNVKPRIIAEAYLQCDEDELRDYKLLCMNGNVRCSFVCSDRFSDKGLHVTFYDREWNIMPFERHYPASKTGVEKPENYEKMLELAEKLAKGIRFVRVDFYENKGKIYFGELTFYPGSGMEEFTPVEWDTVLGSWIKL